MKNIYKFEFYKLIKQKSLYICSAVMLALSLFGALLSKALASNPDIGMTAPSNLSVLLSSVSSSNFTIICDIFIALFVCADYDQGTIKNIYSRGFSRGTVYFSKFTVAIVATTAMFGATLLFNLIVGSSMFDSAAEKGNYVGLLIGQYLYCIAYSTFSFAICLAIKKIGASIALAILGPSLIGTALALADAFLKFKNFKFGNFWLDAFITDLSSVATDSKRMIVCITLSAIYTVIFAAIGYYINKRQEN